MCGAPNQPSITTQQVHQCLPTMWYGEGCARKPCFYDFLLNEGTHVRRIKDVRCAKSMSAPVRPWIECAAPLIGIASSIVLGDSHRSSILWRTDEVAVHHIAYFSGQLVVHRFAEFSAFRLP
jgi:hypothetical protein